MTEKDKRTLQQNKAMHKFFTMMADTLNGAGLDMKKTLEPEMDIPWTPEMVKKHLWKVTQDALYGKESTTELGTAQVDEVYRVLNRHLSEKFGISVPFPSRSGE